jgi:signal transduction histidine kinase
MNTTTDQMPQWEDLVLPKTAATAPTAAPLAAPAPAQAPKPEGQSLPASYLTHELRAPITSIRLGLEILQEQVNGRLAADERQMLNLAVKNTARLEGLVNDIMDYSKIMAGRMKIDREPCDARDLIDEAIDTMRAAAVSHGVKLVKEDCEPMPRVSAEGRRIVQILTNLISNAVKFTPAHGTVTVSVKRGTMEHQGTLIFKVKDTGRGIPTKDLESVFDMFQSTGAVKKSEGTGLGLTLARLMVQIHGGRIWAESWRQMGATFYFTIPIAAEDMLKKVQIYPKEVQYSGLIMDIAKRLNAFMAMFV